MKMTDKSIKIAKTGNPGDENRFLIATMPDGTPIPMQLDLRFRQHLSTPDFVKVVITLECYIPIDEFIILEKDPRITIEESND